LWAGDFSFGGERRPLESHVIYDEINHVGELIWTDEGIGYYVVTNRTDVSAIPLVPKMFSSCYNPNLRVGGTGAPYVMKPLRFDTGLTST
jgi:hypothetical protein